MAAARIAAVIFSVILPAASAQQSVRLTVQVADSSGARIPGARITAELPGAPSASVFMADGAGEAALDLPARSFTLSITAPGFKKWTRQVDVQNVADQNIRAQLQIAPIYFGSGSPNVTLADIPLESPEPAFIPIEPTSNLAPLPSYRPKKR